MRGGGESPVTRKSQVTEPQPVLVAASHTERVETVEEVKAEIVRVFGSQANEALCIAKNESGFRVDATGYNTDAIRSVDRGIFQLNNHWQGHISDAEAYDAKSNIAHAKAIHDGWGSWNAWSTHRLCNL